ncbi:N-6 DNA methylase [Chitinophagaceae bacterium LB-8]|uniref:site-specific DNA-methyltransferase (adenine-specific) n=1 Tax=Paraflavisolibacter caeni TaxID=2982496 RepID=A0A9X3BIQ5_9BACT|nr:N-6 DNA methylase [Paraflavisolibacter caeni]MCU7551782.1 N-6 DNA methylase [Paraflavisolibacter caeni]
MAYLIAKSKAESFEQLKGLIASFDKEYSVLKSAQYSEAQLRIDFLNPLLKTFGWDVDNEESKTQFLRNVIQEESIDVEEDDTITKKNPDYTLRVQGTRKLFVEAKKVSIEIEKSSKTSFQTRRYGWNANLGISILTNFERLIVYDCRHKPQSMDDPKIARYKNFHYTEFLNEFETIYQLFSFQSVSSGYLDDYFSVTENDTITFDDFFLKQIEGWRTRLAADVILNNIDFSEEDINFLIQRLLNRIVFLRICEDREIEKYETLKAIKTYDELKDLFIQSDKKYNSGLFDFIEDNFTLKIVLNSNTLISIFNELYYPESPYDFAVVDPTILSQIYERYLGSKITIVSPTEISIVEEPEVAASSGVVPTPKLVVENIVKETLNVLFDGKNLEQIEQLKIADICCGSGTFLISVYDYLLETFTLAFLDAGITDNEVIYQTASGSFNLTLKAKHTFLLNNIFGVDINPYAVEVTKFSLLLKLIEHENAASVNYYLTKYQQKVLPSLSENIKNGNSLVDDTYFKFDKGAIADDEKLFKIKPFNWLSEFPFLKETKGFDAIVGNPPYVRIQNMVKYLREEIKYYQDKSSGYIVAQEETFDKYYLFIQRAIELLNTNGVLGYIVPNKFFIVKGGKTLRSYITTNGSLNRIVHFGVSQVFPNRSTYTAVLLLDKKQRDVFGFKRVRKIVTEFVAGQIGYAEYNNADYTDKPWIFVSKETEEVFSKIKSQNVIALKNIAEIPVGLQTSADKIYIIEPESETDSTYKFTKLKVQYEVEKAICKPCIYDLTFGLFDTVKPNAQMIFPYNIVDDKAEVLSEQIFQSEFPLAWEYLNKFKDLLSKRSINGSKEPKWYQFGRSQSLTKFHNAPKLIWSVLSTKPGYAYDQMNIQFTGGGNGPYYSLISSSQYSPLYILGILCHPVFEAMVKAGASEFQGAYYSHGKQFIENIPIKEIDFGKKDEKQKHDEIAKTVQQLIASKASYKSVYIDAKKAVLKRKHDYLFGSLVEQVNALYCITEADVTTVMNDEMFIAEINEE